MNGNLYEYLTAGLSDRSRPCFLKEDGDTISYGRLLDDVNRMARHLQACSVGVGDRVVVQASKSVEMVALYLATLQIGAVFVPLNSAYTASEIEYFLEDAEQKLFVQDPVQLARDAASHEPLRDSEPRSGDDIAAIVYTSGTTGRSKGAMLSHANLAANARALCDAWGFTKRDVLLHALPIFHVHGLFVALHCSLLSGCATIWLERFDEQRVIEALPRATVMMGVPTFYTRLLANPGFTRDIAEPVRLFISGSAPLLETAFHEFEARTGKSILERYGMSEAAIITTNPLNGARVAGSVGYPLPGVELRIGGGGEIGGIEIRGPSVFKGYWRNPDKTAEDFTEDGFFKTGDLGRMEADGRVWITGRAKDLVISGGYNVYPKEVELALDDLPGIAESAVIGVPHPDFGEAVVAVVVGEGEERSIIEQAQNRLASFKTPKRIFFVPELPRNALGKVQKNILRDQYRDTFSIASNVPL
jgi:malonyl-CoA/methylmalonyl-CoA synthetase